MDKFINKIILGNAFEVIKTVPKESIDLHVFSPPFFLQRNYGTDPILLGGDNECEHKFTEHRGYTMQPDTLLTGRGFKSSYARCEKCGAFLGEFGQEQTVEEYLEHFMLLLVELKRTLKETGSLWIEIQDKYYPTGYKMESSQANVPEKLKIKICDELGMYCRNTIILHKIPTRPESMKTRFSKKYSYLYFFTKSPSGKHYFDLASVKEAAVTGGYKNPGDLWDVKSTKLKGSNTASFSIDLLQKVILSASPLDGIVMDVFSGVGHTAYMAKILGRNFIGIEYLKENFDKSIKLLNTLDGKLL